MTHWGTLGERLPGDGVALRWLCYGNRVGQCYSEAAHRAQLLDPGGPGPRELVTAAAASHRFVGPRKWEEVAKASGTVPS